MHLPPGSPRCSPRSRCAPNRRPRKDDCPAGKRSRAGDRDRRARPRTVRRVTGGKCLHHRPLPGRPVRPLDRDPGGRGTVQPRQRHRALEDQRQPGNAAVTIVSDPLPTQLKGIPLQLKQVNVSVDRPGFEFNPTNCDADEDRRERSPARRARARGVLAVSGRWLPEPAVRAEADGGRGRAWQQSGRHEPGREGRIRRGERRGVAQAGIAKVDLQLPVALSSRLSTLQKACTEAVFDANPASCDEGSVIGYATIHTPVLSKPAVGPGVSGLSWWRCVPGCRVRAAGRRDHARAGWQDRHQSRRHLLAF